MCTVSEMNITYQTIAKPNKTLNKLSCKSLKSEVLRVWVAIRVFDYSYDIIETFATMHPLHNDYFIFTYTKDAFAFYS